MAAWGAAKAKAQFSEVLDKAASEGPPLVTRRKEEFWITTKQQFDEFQAKGHPPESMADS